MIRVVQEIWTQANSINLYEGLEGFEEYLSLIQKF